VDHLFRGHQGCEGTNLERGNFLPALYYQQKFLVSRRQTLTYLLHRPKHLVATPFGETPVIVILLDAANADGTIGSAASSQESASGKATLLAIEARLGR